jgi:hypothetical protein
MPESTAVVAKPFETVGALRAGQEPSAGDTRLALSPFCDRELIPGLRTDTDGIETYRRDPNTHVVGASGSSAALKS